MLACNRDCGSAKAKCWLAIAIADQQKPDAGLQSRLLISKSQMLACNRNCGSARAKCWLYNRDCWSAKAKCWLTIAIAGQQKPNAGLQSRLLVSKRQMTAY